MRKHFRTYAVEPSDVARASGVNSALIAKWVTPTWAGVIAKNDLRRLVAYLNGQGESHDRTSDIVAAAATATLVSRSTITKPVKVPLTAPPEPVKRQPPTVAQRVHHGHLVPVEDAIAVAERKGVFKMNKAELISHGLSPYMNEPSTWRSRKAYVERKTYTKLLAMPDWDQRFNVDEPDAQPIEDADASGRLWWEVEGVTEEESKRISKLRNDVNLPRLAHAIMKVANAQGRELFEVLDKARIARSSYGYLLMDSRPSTATLYRMAKLTGHDLSTYVDAPKPIFTASDLRIPDLTEAEKDNFTGAMNKPERPRPVAEPFKSPKKKSVLDEVKKEVEPPPNPFTSGIETKGAGWSRDPEMPALIPLPNSTKDFLLGAMAMLIVTLALALGAVLFILLHR